MSRSSARSPRVCIVGREFPPTLGGLADCTYWFARAMAERLPTHVVADTDPSRWNDERFVAHGHRQYGWKGTGDFLRALRSIRPHVLVLNFNAYMFGRHGICPYVPAWMSAYRRLLKGRLIVNFIELYAAATRPRHWPITLAQIAQCRILAAQADAVVTPEAAYAGVLRRWVPKSKPVEVIPVGGNIPVVQMDAHERERLRQRHLRGADFLVGTFSHVRHPEVVVEAWALLRESGLKVRFLTVGDSKRLHPGDREAMISLARQSRVADLFIETGYLEPVDVSRHLQALDAYLYLDHTILTKSGTIMAALEHGLPVVAFHKGDPPPGFSDGTNVRLVRSPEAGPLADVVAQLVASRRIREHLAAGARALYEKHYSWPVISERFLNVIAP